MKQNTKHNILAVSIGVVYLWFGALKFFPDLSPAEGLAKSTIHLLTFGLISDTVSIVLLALWETIIGVFLIFNLWRRTMVVLALLHMVFTFAPLLFFPEQVFGEGPLYLTLLGQYIIKNVIIVAALINLADFGTVDLWNSMGRKLGWVKLPSMDFGKFAFIKKYSSSK